MGISLHKWAEGPSVPLPPQARPGSRYGNPLLPGSTKRHLWEFLPSPFSWSSHPYSARPPYRSLDSVSLRASASPLHPTAYNTSCQLIIPPSLPCSKRQGWTGSQTLQSVLLDFMQTEKSWASYSFSPLLSVLTVWLRCEEFVSSAENWAWHMGSALADSAVRFSPSLRMRYLVASGSGSCLLDSSAHSPAQLPTVGACPRTVWKERSNSELPALSLCRVVGVMSLYKKALMQSCISHLSSNLTTLNDVPGRPRIQVTPNYSRCQNRPSFTATKYSQKLNAITAFEEYEDCIFWAYFGKRWFERKKKKKQRTNPFSKCWFLQDTWVTCTPLPNHGNTI